jgi:putative transposase
MLNNVQYMVDGRRGFQQVLVITNGDNVTVADLEGEILI